MSERRGHAERGAARITDGIRTAAPVSVAVLLVAVSFGAAAQPILGATATIAMSLLVFGASAQFGATAVLAGGGGPAAAVAAGSLLNSRFVPMALAAGPWLSRRPGRRLLEGLAVNDASWALAHLGDGRFDRRIMIGATLIQYPAWVGGTAIGAYAGDVVADPAALGLDAVFPAFFLMLLVDSIGGRPDAARAVAGAAITLALLSFVSIGVAVLAAAAPAAWALRR